MDPMAEEQLDYGEEEYGGQKMQFQGGGAISALTEEDLIGEDDEYDDLYNDVNIGEGFLQLQRSETPVPSGDVGNGAPQNQRTDDHGSRVPEPGDLQEVSIPKVGMEGKNSRIEGSYSEPKGGGLVNKGLEEGTSDSLDNASPKGKVMAPDVRNVGFQGSAPMPQKVVDHSQLPNGSLPLPDSGTNGAIGDQQISTNRINMNVNVNRPMVNENLSRPAVDNGNTMLFVGELQWWTTDAELESVLSYYGRVKEIKFFDERASGKSKGYCQVEFYDSAAAGACKEGMNGHIFNGKACVVTFASPQTLRQMGATYLNKTQAQSESQPQGRRVMNDGFGRGGGMNYNGGDGGRNFSRGGFGRGGQGILNRGPGGGPVRGRGGDFRARSMVGSSAGIGSRTNGVGPYGQGLAGPSFGGPTSGFMPPQSMMGVGFDPTYMGRGGGYGGFPGPAYSGMMSSFPAVNAMAFPGVAPHVNPAFFGRGMSANGMGMMSGSGMDGHHTGMWTDTSMGGWGGGEQGRRKRESSYGGDDDSSNYGYGEGSHERGGRSNFASREKDRGSDHDWSGNSERKHHDEREPDWDQSDHHYREEKDGHRDQRPKARDRDNEDDWDRGHSSSRSRSRSHMMQEEDHMSRTRDMDYGKRQRLPSE